MADKTLLTLEKNDPSIYVTVPISDSDCVGTSLAFINFNFRSIDIALSNIQFSASSYWNKASDYIIQNKTRWDDLIQEYENTNIEFDILLANVQELSADWFTPISVVYPSSITSGQFSVALLSSWVNTNFLINPFSVDDPYCYEYIEGQELYVFTPIISSGGGDTTIGLFKGNEFVVHGTIWAHNGTLNGY